MTEFDPIVSVVFDYSLIQKEGDWPGFLKSDLVIVPILNRP